MISLISLNFQPKTFLNESKEGQKQTKIKFHRMYRRDYEYEVQFTRMSGSTKDPNYM